MFRPYLILVGLITGLLQVSAQQPAVLCNQIGFYPNGPKKAIVTGGKAERFYIVNLADAKEVSAGKPEGVVPSSNSSLQCQEIVFTGLTKPGHYKIVVPGIDSPAYFSVDPTIHREAAAAAVKGYYFQRVSMPLDKQYAGIWARPAGHPDTSIIIHASAATAKRPEGAVISTPGGWYDAGDYNKYIVNSGITMGTLLSAYEDFPDYFDSLSTNIPESKNGIPDLLDEVLYNLRWMLTMQDPYDGGVYNKCTNAGFDGIIMPDAANKPRYVVQKGTAATLDFAAVTAQASRVFAKYKKQLPGLSDSCLTASIKAWNWSIENPALAYNQDLMNKTFKPEISTGGYGDRSFKDEWYWAGVELYITTGKDLYAEAVKKYSDAVNVLPGWPDVGMLGSFSLIRFASKRPLGKDMSQPVHALVLRLANELTEGSKRNAFCTPMGGKKTDFIWGSNAVAANQGWLLVNAYFISGEEKYLHGALANLDYLLGRNATGYSFLTGFGKQSTKHPHHRPSMADDIDAPVPGLLAGGPNSKAIVQDKCEYRFTEAETMYTDVACSYASNEIAINWNAPFVYLAAAMEALMNKR
ncbi:glycoside hydrolase family 9 protein [Terrimonas sp. NA20]|uniref:Endoglucanase n=1 Tax=Terrimonas ginsenosidimutans TaxID=2908004 RepID=A0ABS9KPZ7_9BACT|nr:glycoside hydrolase family 9 protein [Terrimonas ginsenosidimutans]MCG2614384.1 glycoside hydrolase family 9 protein [Terrimonas ginsenosidimutans]